MLLDYHKTLLFLQQEKSLETYLSRFQSKKHVIFLIIINMELSLTFIITDNAQYISRISKKNESLSNPSLIFPVGLQYMETMSIRWIRKYRQFWE